MDSLGTLTVRYFTIFCFYFVCFILVFSHGKLVIPYGEIEGDISLGVGDDESIQVNLRSSIRLWDKDIQKLFISYNGGILSSPYTRMASSDPWEIFPPYSIFPFWEDLVADAKSGHVYYNNNVTGTNLQLIDAIINKINHFELDTTLSGFKAAVERTLVVTYDRMRDFDKTVENSFQVVITTNNDSTQTYLIISYQNMDGPNKAFFPKVGYILEKDNICKFPGSGSLQSLMLECRSNIYLPGTFLVGMTPQSAMGCNSGYIEYTCSRCHFDSVIPNTCLNDIKMPGPKCGSNNISYANICDLKKDLCLKNGSFEISKSCKICDSKTCIHGSCQGKNCMCTKGYTGQYCHQDINECSTNNGECEQGCQNTVGSHTCTCNDGYKLSDVDEKSCITTIICISSGSCDKYNEEFCRQTSLSNQCKTKCQECSKKVCSLQNGGCEDLCVTNNNGTGRSCKCYRSLLNDDQLTCQQRHIYYGNGNTLTISPSQSKTFNDVSFVLGVDHILEIEHILWISFNINDAFSIVNIAPFDDLEKSKVLYKSDTYLEDLSYDPSTGNLYVTEASTKSVSVILDVLNKTSDSLKKVKLLDNLVKPRAIVYEPCTKLLFITDYGIPAIVQLNVDDKTIKYIATDRLTTPNALAVDPVNKKVYWGDADIDKIERANYDGSCREVIYFTDPNSDDEDDSHIFGMVFNNGLLYWTEWIEDKNEESSIMQIDVESKEVSVFAKVSSRPHNIGIVKYNKYQCTSASSCSTPNIPPQTPLSNATCFPYGVSAMDEVLPRGDDLIEGKIQLSRNISLIGHNIDKLFVNVNGYITFKDDVEDFEPDIPYSESVLAIHASDLTTDHAGNIYYREIASYDYLKKISKTVNTYYNTYNAFRAEHAVIITWENMPIVEDLNKRSTFQVTLASDSHRTFAIYCFRRLENEAVVGFYNEATKCIVKSTLESLDLLKKGTMVYNVSPDQCNTNLTQTLNELLPYGRSAGDDQKSISSSDENVTISLGSPTKFLATKTDKLLVHDNGRITNDDPSEDGYISVYSLDWKQGQIYYRVSTHPQDFNTISKDLLNRLGKEKLSSTTFKVLVIITFVAMSTKQDGSHQNTFQFIHISNDDEAYGIFKFQMLTSTQAASGVFDGVCNQHMLPHSSTEQSTLLMFESNVGTSGTFVYKQSSKDCSLPNNTLVFNQHVVVLNQVIGTRNVSVPNESYSAVLLEALSDADPTFVTCHHKEVSASQKKLVLFNFISMSPSGRERAVNVLGIPTDTLSSVSLVFGRVTIPKFGGQTNCMKHVHFDRQLQTVPVIKLTNRLVNAMSTSQKDIATTTTLSWVRNVDRTGFDVCFHELFTLSGRREAIVDYVAVSLGHEFTESKVYSFNELFKEGFDSLNSSVEHNCGVAKFRYVYHYIPRVFVTAEDYYETSGGESTAVISAWLKSVYHDHCVMCVGSSLNTLDHIKVHMLVKGSFDVCSSKKCPPHFQCHVDEEGAPYCGCITSSCPKEDEGAWFCASNFKSYKSDCEMHKDACQLHGTENVVNVTKVHEGRCKHLPYVSGSTVLKPVPEMPSAYCKYIQLPHFYFEPFTKPKIVLSVHWNATESNTTHHTAAVWSEDVSIRGFTACALVSGRGYDDNNNIFNDRPSVYWMVSQSLGLLDVSGGKLESGTVMMPVWYTGSRCVDILLKNQSSKPTIFVSVEHVKPRVFKNAMTVWIEENQVGNQTKYRACARELQNFDGIHRNIKLHWLAVHDIIQLQVSEKKKISFDSILGKPISARCKIVEYNHGYPSIDNPVILLSPQNLTTLSNTASTGYSDKDIVSWIEYSNLTHFKVCLKSIRAGRFQQPITLSYVVLPRQGLCERDWFYHNGYCLHIEPPSVTKIFKDASIHCKLKSSTLVSINSPVTNSFVSRLSENDNIWIGYSDSKKEGKWVWSDNRITTPYSNWIAGKPNGGNDENCAIMKDGGVNFGGKLMKKWIDVDCNATQNFVCQKRSKKLEEACSRYCMNDGECDHTDGNDGGVILKCRCKHGFTGTKCEIDVFKLQECTNYVPLVNQTWRLSYENNSMTRDSNESCDRTLSTNQTEWYRFTGSSGTKLLENTCLDGLQHCGVKYPGWLNGMHPTVYEGVTEMTVHFYSAYCASDQGRISVRNCGQFYVYRFKSLPYWSCDYGLCTIN